MAAARQFNVFGAGNLFRDLLVKRWRRRLVELAADNQRRDFQVMQQRHQIGFLQYFASGMEGLRIDGEQDFFALVDFFRMCRKISRRKHTLGGDLGDASEPAVGDFFAPSRQMPRVPRAENPPPHR